MNKERFPSDKPPLPESSPENGYGKESLEHRDEATSPSKEVGFLVPRGHGLPAEIVETLGKFGIRPSLDIVYNEGQKLAMITRQGIFQGTTSMERVLRANHGEEPPQDHASNDAGPKQEDTDE